MQQLFVIAVAMVLLLSGCGERAETSGSSAGGQTYRSGGTVLESTEHGPELCFGVMDSLPPQCGGIPISNWDWGAVSGEESTRGTTWGEYEIEGKFDGEQLTITQKPRSHTPGDGGGDLTFPTLCDDPVSPRNAATEPEDTAAEIRRYATGQPEFAGLWRSRLDGGDVMNVAFVGELERHRSQIAAIARTRFCVGASRRPLAELERAADEAFRFVEEDLGLHFVSSSVEVSRNRVTLSVWVATQRDQDALDERFGESAVVLRGLLRPVSD